MATKRKQIDYSLPPQKLLGHPFYGLTLDEDQKQFRDSIWDPNIEVVFCLAKAGSGKSLISIATSILMCQYQMYNGIEYIIMATGQLKIGFLPGDSFTKVLPMMSGLWSAVLAINMWPEKVIKGINPENDKVGSAFITALSSTFLRGANFVNKIVIIDEAQNMTIPLLRKTLTRVCNGCKTIVIGHSLQTDINPQASGFTKCMLHFKSKNDDRFAFCKLNTCHRGIVAQVADLEW